MKKRPSKVSKIHKHQGRLSDCDLANLSDEKAENFLGGAIALPLDLGREYLPNFPTCPNPENAAPGC